MNVVRWQWEAKNGQIGSKVLQSLLPLTPWDSSGQWDWWSLNINSEGYSILKFFSLGNVIKTSQNFGLLKHQNVIFIWVEHIFIWISHEQDCPSEKNWKNLGKKYIELINFFLFYLHYKHDVHSTQYKKLSYVDIQSLILTKTAQN